MKGESSITCSQLRCNAFFYSAGLGSEIFLGNADEVSFFICDVCGGMKIC